MTPDDRDRAGIAWRNLPDGRRIAHLERTGSTQDVARALVRAGEPGLAAVVAAEQTAGRGRMGAEWVAPAGQSLLATYVLGGPDCLPAIAWRLAFVGGVAVSEAIRSMAPVDTRLKWPNDILIGDHKVAGILIETEVTPAGPVALMGIGVNVNETAFPPGLRRQATSLCLETGAPVDIDALEEAVRIRLDVMRVAARKRGLAWLLAGWRERDATTGQRYATATAGGEAEGVAVGIAPTGELVLRMDGGETITTPSASWAPILPR